VSPARAHRPRAKTVDDAHAWLRTYRQQIATGHSPSARCVANARGAYLLLGGDPERPSFSLKDYDHEKYGPFLGVSDEGSAVTAIREAAYASPKAITLAAAHKLTPQLVGVAIDAERLGGIGEIAVGPDEYADVWAGAVDRLLITTNVGTRVNLRVYGREPRVQILNDSSEAITRVKQEMAKVFQRFVNTPDSQPRPCTLVVNIPWRAEMSQTRKTSVLSELFDFVSSGKAAGRKKCPEGHCLGLAVWARWNSKRDDIYSAIDLAEAVGIRLVVVDGSKRKQSRESISLAGLLEYFQPAVVRSILRYAKRKGVVIRAANLPDTDTIARSTWSGLRTARSMGVHLGKYGCFPLTLDETDRVIQQVQNWFEDWSAAPALFLDQGILYDGGIAVGKDLVKGVELWLTIVARRNVRVVLLDTIDKASGRRLIKQSSDDKKGCLDWREIDRIEKHARELKLRVLWAGGLSLRDAFHMGRIGVFGIYVTSAVADTIAVPEDYKNDPLLPSLKEPSRDAILRLKIVLEAAFLVSGLAKQRAAQLEKQALELVDAVEARDHSEASRGTDALSSECVSAWRTYWNGSE
jgi:hypothetical protein